MTFLSPEEVNTGRQPEADLLKSVALFALVIVHCFEIFTGYSAEGSTVQFVLVYVLNFIFGAASFMFCMGLGIAYSRRDAVGLMKRGVRIFLLGYVLTAICALYLLVPAGDPMGYLLSVLQPDIMQFAGLALLLFGFLRYCRLSDAWIAAVAATLSLIGTFLGTVELHRPIPTLLAGLFIGSFDFDITAGAVFPLLNWFIFVVGGYLFGQLLRRCTDKKRMYLLFSGLSGLVLAIYLLLAIPGRRGMMGSYLRYCHIRFPDALVCLAGAVFALGVYYALTRLLPGILLRGTERLSRHINTIYCVQWVVIAWTAAVLFFTGHFELSDGTLLVMGIGIFLFAAALAELRDRRKERRTAKAEK